MTDRGHGTSHLGTKLPLKPFSCAQDSAQHRHAIQMFPFNFCPQLFFLFSFFRFISLLSHTYVFFSLQLLNRKDKTTFEKLDYLMSKEDNYKRTREYIRSLKMVPSIPYLGRNPNRLLFIKKPARYQIRCFVVAS